MSLLHSASVGQEDFQSVVAARAALLGDMTGAPQLRGSDVGLLYLINEKQRLLQQTAERVDLEAIAPLRLVLEFASFVVSGLILEAERIDSAFIEGRKDVAALGVELRAADMDLQFRWEHSGTRVHQAIAQHYKTRIVVPASKKTIRTAGAATHRAAAQMSEFHSIQQHRDRMTMLRHRQTALARVQRLMHGSGVPVSESDALAHVKATHTLYAMRQAAHRIRDIQAEVPEAGAVPEIQSLLDFITHVDAGLSAAVEDLEACALSIRKAMIDRDRDDAIRAMNAANVRNKHSSSSAMRQNEQASRNTLLREPAVAVAPKPRVTSETDEFLKLYCSN